MPRKANMRPTGGKAQPDAKKPKLPTTPIAPVYTDSLPKGKVSENSLTAGKGGKRSRKSY